LPGTLLIAAGPGEWRAALLEDGAPVELFVERGDGSETGSIHLGRARRLLPALDAMLVDIGTDRPAFLPASEILPRNRRLDEGERVIAQIRRESQGGKAARLTTGVVLRGKLLELSVGRSGIRGGETLSPAERAKLSGAAGEGAAGLRLLKPEPIDLLITELADLNRRWRTILDRAASLSPPARLYPPLSFAAAVAAALSTAPDRIVVDDPAIVPELRAVFPDTAIQHEPETEWSIELDVEFDRALARTLALAGGGSVHIEATRTAVLIDVDSGSPQTGAPEHTGLAVNLAAADVIARQIRLRNLGGGIVIDFVGLETRKSRERIRDALAEALTPDSRCPQILGWTRLGHLELVRPRLGTPLAEVLLEPRPWGPFIKTAVTVAHEALRALRREVRAQPQGRWRVVVNPDVAAAFDRDATTALRALEERFGRPIAIETDPGLNRERFHIAPA
jgi:ribonuclease G